MIYPEGRAWLFVGMSRNDVTVNSKVGVHVTTVNNYLKLLVIKLIHNTASEALDSVLNVPEQD